MTAYNVHVMEGKATELNFTLAPVVSEAPGNTSVTTQSVPSTTSQTVPSTSVSPSTPTQTQVVPSETRNQSSPASRPPSHEPIQPHEFRHHNYADMELFLRKYQSEFPAITHLYSVGRSVQRRELYVMVISDNPTVHEHGML